MIIHSPEKHEWNPDPRSALETLAHEDPDPELRERAARVLAVDLDHVAARMRRFLARIGEEKGTSLIVCGFGGLTVVY